MSTENKKVFEAMDGNTATAHSAYAFTEVAGIYPITPSSPMAEHVDDWATAGRKNIFGDKVKVVEMQSEGGAAGAVHGALQAGSLATTFTASQGLLLMIPNLYKLKGEMLPGVLHVAARSLATHTLSIFGDHQDVYACRQTGMVMMCSHSVQDCMDMAGVAHLIAIDGSVPVMHFFDGFRTSHEIDKIEVMDYDFLKSLLPVEKLEAFRKHALNPHGNAVTRGGSQNDDIYFQAAEAQNEHYAKVTEIAAKYMKAVSEHTGRNYAPFTYVGAPDAERVIVAMGSVTDTITETINTLIKRGEKVGLIKVYLYRPFSQKYLEDVLPATVKKIAVLDRAKEVGTREPLFLDVCYALRKHKDLVIVGGRYGLSSKDTNPSDINGVFEELKKDEPKEEFTIGITDDVTHLSLEPVDIHVDADYTSCLFYGLGSDGTVSANKSSVKIIGDATGQYAQAYFQYDSRKSGGTTRSHLRFGKTPIRSEYYVKNADFISCSLDTYILKYDIIANLKDGGTFLLNTNMSDEELAKAMPNRMKHLLAEKHVKFYAIDANKLAEECHMGRHTNTTLQAAFFKLNPQIMPYEQAEEWMKKFVKKTYERKGMDIVQNNYDAIDAGPAGLREVKIDPEWIKLPTTKVLEDTGDTQYDEYVGTIDRLDGDELPTSEFLKYELADGTMEENIVFRQKRAIADRVPVWNPQYCIECNQCAFVCPHATIRPYLLNEEELAKAPEMIKNSVKPVTGSPKAANLKYRITVATENCVGCGLCVSECMANQTAKKLGNDHMALVMKDAKAEFGEQIAADYCYYNVSSKTDIFPLTTVKGVGFLRPYMEVSGACAGCGEAPYYRLLSQLFGHDLLIANATGCSSIYCGSTPLTPFIKDKNGEGVAWANSLFEDNAEYGFGMRIATDYKMSQITRILNAALASENVEDSLKDAANKYLAALANKDRDAERLIVPTLEKEVDASKDEAVKELKNYYRDLIEKSVWIIGGDGWSYDIGYGGLDHVLANEADVNVLVLDTEVYSNTGGQASKSSQTGSINKFTASGKKEAKKNLALMAMSYGHVYVAQIALGANPMKAIQALKDAESYNGPSLVICYCPCLEQHIKGGLVNSIQEEKRAVECGYFTCFRYDPRLVAEGKPGLTIDCKEPDWSKFRDFLMLETRFSQLPVINPEHSEELLTKCEKYAKDRWEAIKKFGL